MSDEGDRSIPAGDRRLARARERGMVPVRRGLVALGGITGAASASALFGTAGTLVALLRQRLSVAGTTTTLDAAGDTAALVGDALVAAWPAMVGGVLGALAATLVQTRGVLVWRRPSADLAARLKSMSSPKAAARAFGGLVWVIAAAVAAGAAMAWQWPLVAALPRMPMARAVGEATQVIVVVCASTLAALAVCALVDMVLARRAWRQGLALTPEAARQDERVQEGDPALRARRRRAARGLLRSMRSDRAPSSAPASQGATAPVGGSA